MKKQEKVTVIGFNPITEKHAPSLIKRLREYGCDTFPTECKLVGKELGDTSLPLIEWPNGKRTSQNYYKIVTELV